MSNNIETKSGYPRGLYFLSSTEMWERFSYYGIMSVLILYLTKGLGIPDEQAGLIVGTYISFTWMSPVLGGWLADNFLGQVNAIRVGGMGIFLGNLILALNFGGLTGFFLGLSIIIIGTGLLKSSISVIVGQLFEDGDPRIDRAYTIFYLFINIGSTLSAAISEISERSGNYSIGFSLATIGMLAGLFIFYKGMKHYSGGARITSKASLHEKTFGISNKILIAIGLIIALPIVVFFFTHPAVTNIFMLVISVLVIGVIVFHWVSYKEKRDRLGIFAILIYVVYQIAYFSLYQQVSDSIILYMDRAVNMNIAGVEISSGAASLLFNSAFIIFLAPGLAALYTWMGKKGFEPSTPVKFFSSLVCMALSFLVFGLEARSSLGGVPGSIWMVILGFFVFTVSDVLSGPISLSLVAQLSPKKITGFMMGSMFFSMAAGGYISGMLTAWAGIDIDDTLGTAAKTALYAEKYSQLFLYCAGAMLVIALLYLIVVPFLNRAHKFVANEE